MEMKKDIEWLKGLINEEGIVMDMHLLGRFDEQYWKNENIKINKGRLFYLIDQLDETEKPVIPKFVADYIERWKHNSLTIYEWFTFGNNDMDYDIERWLYNNTDEENRRREYLLFDAIRNGYEVEKEQKYQVIIRDGEYIRLFLCKHGDNVMIGTNDSYIEKCPEVTYLTEKEIKDYDERFWVFAEEIVE